MSCSNFRGTHGNSALNYGYGCLMQRLVSSWRNMWSLEPVTKPQPWIFGVVVCMRNIAYALALAEPKWCQLERLGRYWEYSPWHFFSWIIVWLKTTKHSHFGAWQTYDFVHVFFGGFFFDRILQMVNHHVSPSFGKQNLIAFSHVLMFFFFWGPHNLIWGMCLYMFFPNHRNLVGGFKYFFIFTPTWGNDPIWRIFFKGVETTN